MMQKLVSEKVNTPLDASLVQCNCDLQLNRDQSLSVASTKTSSNNPEVNLRQHTGGSDLRVLNIVYVLNQRGQPLMPTSQAVARRLLRQGAAHVIKRFPYVIQLTRASGENKQQINLGVDTGYGNIGFSATTSKKELICGTLVLDNRTKERLDEKKMYRRGRRNRLWYREPRWLNRTKKENWLPPSIMRRYLTHMNLILKIHNLLPITNIIVEVAKFDIQKIENSDIQGIGYQQGTFYDYQNVRAYLMSREHGKCQLCGKDFKGQSSHIHHIKPKSKGGNNRPNNLSLLHEKCHTELHRKNQKLKSNTKDYKHSTFMNVVNKRFQQDIYELKITYGHITWVKRNELRLEKTHYNDAFVISGGQNQERIRPIEIKQIHRNNRVLQLNRKGFKPSIKKEKSKVNPEDLFWVAGKKYSCKGMFNKGLYICYGSTKKKEYFSFKKVEKIYKQGSLIWN